MAGGLIRKSKRFGIIQSLIQSALKSKVKVKQISLSFVVLCHKIRDLAQTAMHLHSRSTIAATQNCRVDAIEVPKTHSLRHWSSENQQKGTIKSLLFLYDVAGNYLAKMDVFSTGLNARRP
ncbi:hypothetical protein RF679_13925 [Undibacterium cyanobacteriorum]|uniref:Uncharacterized protein n=1 Tax=Undibacterium cyanobacteriorum TaxID=3073561 RepID=A0ABY9RFV9_9BURK|nr:hypothetical protein [Undibacterium sp. 20NA77.5]WMW79744.1 hypothetical protein RF679_13925 [Undibacterium sp. 20NA77.5]